MQWRKLIVGGWFTSRHRGASMAEVSPLHVRRNGFILTALHEASFLVDFLENDIVRFDENLIVVL